MRVLVTGARLWYALNSVRLLAREGHEVFAADSSKISGGLYSKYLKGKFIYPAVSGKSDEFINCLLKKIEELDIDVLYPTFEEGFVISRFINRFQGRVKVMLPLHKHIQLLHDKLSMTRYAQSLKIPTPFTALLKDCDRKRLKFPLVIKPRDQRSAEGVKRVDSLAELQSLSGALDGSRFIVQEWKQPHQICTMGLAYNGKLVGNVIYHNLREYPPTGGVGTCRISIEKSELETHVKKLVSNLNYSGFISTDFLHNPENGQHYLVDVNPRMSPGLLVGHHSGINFAKAYLDMIESPETVFLPEAATGTGTYTTAMEIGWYAGTLFKGQFRKLRAFFKSRKGLKDDTWDARDPIPFLVVLFSMAYTAIFGHFIGGQAEGFLRGATYDSSKFATEWDGSIEEKKIV